MVDVVGANEKLRDRMRRIVGDATGASVDDVDAALAAANGDARVAIVSLLADVDTDTARARLAESGRSIGRALEHP
jgi:N-acetylmuramic acid 6-phosphate etherase